MHSTTAAIPADQLVRERALLRPLPSGRPPLRQGAERTVDRTGLVRQRVEVAAEDGASVIRAGGAEVIRHAPVAALPGWCRAFTRDRNQVCCGRWHGTCGWHGMTSTTVFLLPARATAPLSERTGLDAVLRFVARNPYPVVHQLDTDPDGVVSLFGVPPAVRKPIRAN